jgi:DNA-binding transcriptional LysR family regulator
VRLSTRQLEIFAAAFRLRSTRHAAASLHISQPAVSRAITELEATIGVALFDRAGRRFEPTFAARSLHDAVLRHHNGLQRIADAARLIASGVRGHVRIVSLPVLADGRVAAVAGRLMARHAALRLDMEAMGEHDCMNELRSGRADIAIVSTLTPDEELMAYPLQPLKPVLAIRSGDPLAARSKVHLKQLGERGLLTLPPDSPFRRALERVFAIAQVPLRVRSEARTQSALLALVRQGAGVAIVDRSAAQTAPSDIVTRPLAEPLAWPVTAIVNKSDADSPTVRLLLAELNKPER